MKLKALVVLTLLIMLMAAPAEAAEFFKPDRSGNTAISGDGHRNVYAGGGNVTITTNIGGDLIAGGGNVLIQGAVEQDLMAGGGTVTVSGAVGSNARLGGGNITVSGPIRGDLLVGGGNVTIASSAEISGDLVAGAGNILVEAPVAGNVRIAGGTITINNRISGIVTIVSDQDLTFGPKAVITGKISHKGQRAAIIEEGAQVGQIEYKKIDGRGGKDFPGRPLAAGSLIWILGLIVAGLLLMHFLPKRVSIVVNKAFDKPWTNLGVGLLFAIVLPIIAVLSVITVLGFYVGIVIITWLILIGLVISILEAVFLGVIILKWLKKYDSLRWPALVIGAIALLILSFIPILGALACSILWLIVFGGALRAGKEMIMAENQSSLSS